MSSAASARVFAADLLVHAAAVLARAGIDESRFEASLILALAAGVPRAHVMSASLEPDDAATARFYAILERRVAREPLACIVGHKEFFSLELDVTPAVLIPRPETETLVETALGLLQARKSARVLDLGTGSGAIAVALACNAPDASILATDISADALAVARGNARRHGVEARIEFRLGSWFEPLRESPLPQPFDLIVSNPPYVEDAALASLAPEVARFEPRIALAGGRDGLDSYRAIAASVRDWLAPGGDLLLEIGAGQHLEVTDILVRAELTLVDVINDLSGIPRVVHARG